MYSAHKLNKQGDNIQPWSTPFPSFEPVSCSMSSSNCCFWTCIQVYQETGKVVWHSHFFKNCPQCFVIYTVKGFSLVNEAEVFFFFLFFCFFLCLFFFFFQWMLVIWSLVPLSFLNPACTGSSPFMLKSSLKDFEHYVARMWNECNCAVVWTFFGIAFLWDWNENWSCPVLWPLLSFPKLLAYWMQYFNSIIFYALKQFNWIPSPPLPLFIVMLP